MSFIGIGSEKGTSENLEKALLAELKKIQDSGVTAKELEKAKNQLISQCDPCPRNERRKGDRYRTGGRLSRRS